MKTKATLRVVGHGAKFGRKMDQAITALMSKPTVEDSAHSIGVSANTLLRWMKEPQFEKAYGEARHAVFSQSIARLQEAASTAVTALLEVVRDKKAPAGIRVRAADIVLVHGARAVDDLIVRAADKTPRRQLATR